MKLKNSIKYDELQEILNAPISFFHQFGDVTETLDGVYIHKSRGSNILAVAHLDSVNDHNHFYVNNFAGDDIVFNTHLDDRLGVYIILKVLPLFDIHYDLLLTEGEEVGQSTAKHFKANVDYNWMFSFDRRGVDVVHYIYSMFDWTDALKKSFGDVSRGSNSDINYLDHLGCCGVNVGTGYHDEHNLMAFANMTQTLRMIGKFIQFYHANKRTFFKYMPYTALYPKYDNRMQNYSKPVVQSQSEEAEELDDDDMDLDLLNPYGDLIIEMPLDLKQYTDSDGVVTHPIVCAFCIEPLNGDNLHAFLGICKHCERWAIQCVVCESFVCREDSPTPEEEPIELWGICNACEDDQYERRFISKKHENQDSRLRTINEDGDDQPWVRYY